MSGSDDLSLLSLSLILPGASSSMQLIVNGMKKTNEGITEYIEWVNEDVFMDGDIRITPVQNSLSDEPINIKKEKGISLKEYLSKSDEVIDKNSKTKSLDTNKKDGVETDIKINFSELCGVRYLIGEEFIIEMSITWHQLLDRFDVVLLSYSEHQSITYDSNLDVSFDYGQTIDMKFKHRI